MNREQRRKEARQYRSVPVTRTQRKQRALAFIAGLVSGPIVVLVFALLLSIR